MMPSMGEGLCGKVEGCGPSSSVSLRNVRTSISSMRADCEFNQVDFMHLTRKGHAQLADLLAKEVPTLL